MATNTILKRKLAEAGIQQAEIARQFNRTVQHVNYVVNGVRKSKRLSDEILDLCENKRDRVMRRAITQIGKAMK